MSSFRERPKARPSSKPIALSVALLLGLVVGNGRGGSVSVAQADSGTSGAVTVHLSNRSAQNGGVCRNHAITHVYVTVGNVQAHRSGANAGWQSLTPNLAAAPVQVDLMADAPGAESSETPNVNDCALTTLDEGTSGLPAGKYQQLRLFVVPNGGSPAPSTNACASVLGATVYNCADVDGTLVPLTIPSGSQTGIKIPSSQISHGGLTIQAGQGVDLDIDLDGCRSMVLRGGGHGHRKNGGTISVALKPVLHAGEVTLNPLIAGDVMAATSSGGAVTVGSTGVASANVWLEEVPGTDFTEGDPAPTATAVPVNNVVATGVTDSNGHFAFCPVPAGSYEIVVDTGTSDATITTAVNVAASGGPNDLVIPLVSASTTAPNLNGQFTTANATAAGDVITFGGTQSDGAANQAQIPFLDGSAPLSQNVTTGTFSSTNCPASVTTCPTGTNCVCFLLPMPPDSPVIGAASADGSGYTQATSAAAYSVFGNASSITSPGTAECSPASLITGAEPATLPTPTLSFASCD